MRCDGSSTGKPRSKRPSMMLKMAVLTPMAMASVRTVITVAPSWRRSKREAKRMSCAVVPTNVPMGIALLLRLAGFESSDDRRWGSQSVSSDPWSRAQRNHQLPPGRAAFTDDTKRRRPLRSEYRFKQANLFLPKFQRKRFKIKQIGLFQSVYLVQSVHAPHSKQVKAVRASRLAR